LACWYRGEGLAAAQAKYDEVAFLPADVVGTEAEGKFAAAVEKGRELLAGYVAKYPTEPWEVLLVPDEAVFVPFGDEDELEFIPDLVVRMNEAVWVVDHKVPRATGDSYYAPFVIDLQATSYLWGIEKKLSEPVAGFIVNVLKKTKVPRFERKTFSRTARDLEDFEEQTRAKLWEMKFVDAEVRRTMVDPRHQIEEGSLYSRRVLNVLAPQNTDQCSAHFGVCEFMDLCETRGALTSVEANYRDREKR
jgi:hypothetical protein